MKIYDRNVNQINQEEGEGKKERKMEKRKTKKPSAQKEVGKSRLQNT